MDVTVNEANPAGAPQPTWPGTRYSGPLTVACIDLGVDKGLAVFKATYTGPGGRRTRTNAHCYPNTKENVREDFVSSLAQDLVNGAVALGIEGPLWGKAEGPLGPYRKRQLRWHNTTCPRGKKPIQFEAGNAAWYGASGGPAALKAFVILRDLLPDLCRKLATLGGALSVTYGDAWEMNGPSFLDPDDKQPRKGCLLLWEAFVTGDPRRQQDRCGVAYKPPTTPPLTNLPQCVSGSTHLLDAFFAVEHGYANKPKQRCPPKAQNAPTTIPIAGAAIELAGLAQGTQHWWNTPCLVIGPRPRTEASADLLWP